MANHKIVAKWECLSDFPTAWSVLWTFSASGKNGVLFHLSRAAEGCLFIAQCWLSINVNRHPVVTKLSSHYRLPYQGFFYEDGFPWFLFSSFLSLCLLLSFLKLMMTDFWTRLHCSSSVGELEDKLKFRCCCPELTWDKKLWESSS